MYEPLIIGNELVKEVLIISESSAGHGDYIGRGSNKKRRRRVNVGLVGPVGQAKSALARKISGMIVVTNTSQASNPLLRQ